MKKRQRNVVNDIQRSNLIRPQPRNPHQAQYLDSIQGSAQTFGLGPAGTGKTFLAASMAAFLYLRGQIERIILSRPKVEVEEAHGFLPGDLHKKLAPWTLPVIEVIEECLGREAVNQMIKSGEVQQVPLGFMRGRTLRNALVILDEAQNTTQHQMKMFLTRIGEGTRIVVNGDIRQKDIKAESGLGMAIDMIRRYGIPATIVEFTKDDVVRSEICAMWVDAFEKEEGEADWPPQFLRRTA